MFFMIYQYDSLARPQFKHACTETYITEECLTDGKPDPGKIDPLIFSPSTVKYHRLGEVVATAFKIGKE